MYYEYYELRENPFNVTADPDFFFSSRQHCEALSNLQYGIEQRKGIMVITGEVGTGKTTICRKLLRELDRKTQVALILNPCFSEEQLLRLILLDLGLRTREQTKFGLIQVLNKYLLKQTKRGRNVVVVIDEAQNLSVEQLEQIRLLSNLETDKEKLLQLILVGQPELDQHLLLPELRQLRQRVSVYYRISPLDRYDVKSYIDHRLSLCSRIGNGVRLVNFSDAAVDCIIKATGGSPRAVNILCDRALTAGFAAGAHVIDETIIQHCAKEVFQSEHHL